MHNPVASLRLSVNSVLTVFGLLNRIKSTPVQLKVSPCVHKTLSEINFPSSSLSVISPRNFVSWCFLSLHPQYWGLSYVLLPCTLGSGSASRLKLGEDREKHTQRGCSILVPSYEEDSFSPSGFRLLQGPGFCRVPLLLAIAVVINCCGLRYRRVEDGGKMRYFCSLAAHLEYSLQIIEPEWRLLLEFCPSAPQCVEFRPEYTRGGERWFNLPLDWWHFESWSSSLCLILFTLQNP